MGLPRTFGAVVGVLLEVHPGQALRVRPFTGGEDYDMFVMDPEPYRGHEGKVLVWDFDDFMVPLPVMGVDDARTIRVSRVPAENL